MNNYRYTDDDTWKRSPTVTDLNITNIPGGTTQAMELDIDDDVRDTIYRLFGRGFAALDFSEEQRQLAKHLVGKGLDDHFTAVQTALDVIEKGYDSVCTDGYHIRFHEDVVVFEQQTGSGYEELAVVDDNVFRSILYQQRKDETTDNYVIGDTTTTTLEFTVPDNTTNRNFQVETSGTTSSVTYDWENTPSSSGEE